MDDQFEDDTFAKPVNASDIDDEVAKICSLDTKSDWRSGGELDLPPKKWRPSALSADGSRLLYVCIQSEFPQFVIDRLRLAKERTLGVTLGLTIASLYSLPTLKVLAEVDADVMVLDDYDEKRRYEPRHFLAAIADIGAPVAPKVRQLIGRKSWMTIHDGTNFEKGRRLESLLAFLFSQVRDLKVVERNFRSETEEIDLVLQIDNFSSRAWQASGVPFILVEAKNRQDKASQQMVSVLIAKLQTKRGSAKIGFLISLAGFTKDAEMQELRFSTQEICIVMIDGASIESLLCAEDLDESLEALVRHALLR